jgi:uncharacterized protein
LCYNRQAAREGGAYVMNIDDWLLEILVCPKCHAAVRPDEEAGELVCTGCGLAYPVRDDIPVMLVEEARQT